MESIVGKVIFFQWQRKLFAIITAMLIWFFVNHTITTSKTIPSVPIRVINLPVDKTIQGLLPNGFLIKRTTLTLSGTKEIIEQLEPGDIEVLLDVSNLPNEAIIQINKKNLISLNPNINLSKHITSVTNPEFVIKMSPVLTEKIDIHIHPPIGSAPSGYVYLDIWPIHLIQTVTGPQDQVLQLKNQGLDFTVNLDEITKEQLEDIFKKNPQNDEVSFIIPENWKKVNIPFMTRGLVPINDPEANNLKINFLKKALIPFAKEIPVHIFYPLQFSQLINPSTYALEASEYIHFKNDLPILNLPIFVKNVSRFFVEVVKDNIELEIVTVPKTERERLEWSIGFINVNHLEDTYTAHQLSQFKEVDQEQLTKRNREKEDYFRRRFRLYMRRFKLYLSSQYKLELESKLEGNKISIHIPNASLVLPLKGENAS
ncbi:MAG: hypothetical protein Q8K60_01340 [Parachlamydiaceae bacterium]|nr:hypothetical protein [Parachlamydiaceae bacterium]